MRIVMDGGRKNHSQYFLGIRLRKGIINRMGHVFKVKASPKKNIIAVYFFFCKKRMENRIRERGIMSNCPWKAIIKREIGLRA